MRITDTSDLWWKTAVVYCLDVQTFMDWDDDGMGDFVGLAERLDYLDDLGVTCLWLMPFYPTADRDDGYDITDYYGVDPRLGTAGDFVEFVRTARDRGMRVIVDLVVNHTSDKHPWFRSARSSTHLAVPRLLRLARRQAARHLARSVVFPDKEDSLWQYDEKTGAWYFHRFYRSQPDLNITNASVRDEIVKVMGFWLELGHLRVPGRRRPVRHRDDRGGRRGAGSRSTTRTTYLRELRAFVGRRTGDGDPARGGATCRTRTSRSSSAAPTATS